MVSRHDVRLKVWSELKKVAYPDSRFHFDFSEFIADFEGSEKATGRLIDLDIYKNSQVVFVTPDNCLEMLRSQVIEDKKVLLTTTYGIRRGFVELLPEQVPEGLGKHAVMLDVIEKIGRFISLKEIKEKYSVDLLVTGGSAVTLDGLRVGKGHGFFDIEWATMFTLGVVNTNTPVVDLVHDCQIVDEDFKPEPYDTVCDYIVTPSKVVHVESPQKPTSGILWEKLNPEMLQDISILEELKKLD